MDIQKNQKASRGKEVQSTYGWNPELSSIIESKIEYYDMIDLQKKSFIYFLH